MIINIAKTHDELSQCFNVMTDLRPRLTLEEFLSAVQHMNETHGYEVAYLKDKDIVSVAGYRISHWLHTGKYLEIEDFITIPSQRSKGYGAMLFDWIVNIAKSTNCNQIRLVSGIKRERAHKFYLEKGMIYEAKYFSMNL